MYQFRLIFCSSHNVSIARVRVIVLTATFNNISVISWRSVILVEETGVSGDVACHLRTLSHNVVLSTPRYELTTLGTDCIGSFKSNNHTTTTPPCNYCRHRHELNIINVTHCKNVSGRKV